MIKIPYNDIMRQASGEYLTNNLPEGFESWEEDQLMDFIDENAWAPLESETPERVYQLIEASADSMASFLESNCITVIRERAEADCDLLPCPFCGGHAIILQSPNDGTWMVGCNECESSTGRFDYREDVIDFWQDNRWTKKKHNPEF